MSNSVSFERFICFIVNCALFLQRVKQKEEKMDSIKQIMGEYERISELVADAFIRRVAPIEDDISENQARKAYGARWLRKMKADGLAKYARVGGRVLYSRHQLNCRRAAERTQAKLIKLDKYK